MPTKNYSIFILVTILFVSVLNGQIKIKESAPQNISQLDPIFFDISQTREIRQLSSGWKVYSGEKAENLVDVSIPSAFSGEDFLNYTTQISFSKQEIENNFIELNFLGISYSAEIMLNEVILYKHPGGLVPFSIELPKDIINTDVENILTVKVNSELDSESTIPLYQRFLFPRYNAGILRDVYISLKPVTRITEFNVDYNLSENFNSAVISFNSEFVKAQKSVKDSIVASDNFSVNLQILSEGNTLLASKQNLPVVFNSLNQAKLENTELNFSEPKLWSPDFPNRYIAKLQLVNGGQVIDETSQYFTIYKLERSADGLLLNGNDFSFAGTGYEFSEAPDDKIVTITQFENDLARIKELGFNTVQFSKSIPHPYLIELCQENGLFAAINLPLNSVPDEFASSENFKIRAKGYLSFIYNYFAKHQIVELFGVGSSYVSNSQVQISFVDELASIIKEKSSKLVYASFFGVPKQPLDNLDFYGVELYSSQPTDFFSKFTSETETIGFNNIMIADAVYPTYLGGTNGYANKYSYEGQAKFLERVIDYQKSNKLAGFITASAFDFNGDFNSLYTGYNQEKLYNIGLLGKERSIGRLSAKVLKAKLKDAEKVTIPIGTNNNNSPIEFILIGVGLSICMALLINSKRKFREDASRALLRPYNFFADIRDHRILSGIHSSLLMICLAGSFALLITILLFFLKNNFLLDKIILSFGCKNLNDAIGFLAWNPITAFLYIYALTIVAIIMHTGVVKVLSFFVRTKILTTSIFFTIIWAILPLALLLPLELILHRVLLAEVGNLYIYGFLILYLLWLIQRMMKGIYVIFDVRAATIYMYGFLIFIFLFGGMLLYFHLTQSTIYLIINAIKQYQIL